MTGFIPVPLPSLVTSTSAKPLASAVFENTTAAPRTAVPDHHIMLMRLAVWTER